MNEMSLRNRKMNITGRSPILNIAAIVINLIAVYLIVAGYHPSTNPDYSGMLKIGGFALLGLSIFSMVALKGLFLFSYVARVLVGGLFIVSGLVKANDPWGFAFKLEEYFEPGGLSYDFPFFESFSDYVLELSILICVVEIILGAAVILGGKIKLASWALVIMMIFFTWLTWYTHSCNEAQMLALEMGENFDRQCVTDCGCFGDALRGSVGRSLTPLESFWKDLVLFYFCIIIFANQWKIKLNTVKENWIMIPASLLVVIFFSWVFGWLLPVFFAIIALLGAVVTGNLNIAKVGKAWKMAGFVAVLALLFSLYTTNYLPLKDYRPYAVGNNIKEQMNNGVNQVAEYIMIYKDLSSGEEIEVSMDNWTAEYSDTTKFEYVDNKTNVIVPGKDPSILDFSARGYYDNLSATEKESPIIDSIIQSDYASYYEDKYILSSINGMDTVPVVMYDTLTYPDSMYQIKEKFEGLIDSDMPFTLDFTSYLLNQEYLFLMTIRDIESINKKSIDDFKALHIKATEAGIPFYVLSPAGSAEIEAFKKEHDFSPNFLGFDGVEVKIIVRSNPGLVLLNNATVLDKWPSRSIPEFEDIQEDYIKINTNE